HSCAWYSRCFLQSRYDRNRRTFPNRSSLTAVCLLTAQPHHHLRLRQCQVPCKPPKRVPTSRRLFVPHGILVALRRIGTTRADGLYPIATIQKGSSDFRVGRKARCIYLRWPKPLEIISVFSWGERGITRAPRNGRKWRF